MKKMYDISDKIINNIIDSDIIENYSYLPDEVKIYEIGSPLFFASARTYTEAIEKIGLICSVLILRIRHVSFIDQTGLHNLKDSLKILRNKKITILLSQLSEFISESCLMCQTRTKHES